MEARDAVRFLLKSGNLRTVLRMQVQLRNADFDEVEITGHVDPLMETALKACFSQSECTAKLTGKI